jgi:hypothetical protein
MKKQVMLGLLLLGLLPGPKAQNAKVNNVPFADLAARYNTLNERNQLMRARNVIRFENEDGKCRREPLEILFEKQHGDERKKYSLYQWDAALRRWIKKSAFLRAGFYGTHDYYSIKLSCDGVYGLFEELRSTSGTLVKLPGPYQVQSLRFEQENMGVVFEWAQRTGAQEVKIPFDPVSPLALLTLELRDGKTGEKEMHNVRMGLFKIKEDKNSRTVCYSADARFMQEHIINKSLNAVK